MGRKKLIKALSSGFIIGSLVGFMRKRAKNKKHRERILDEIIHDHYRRYGNGDVPLANGGKIRYEDFVEKLMKDKPFAKKYVTNHVNAQMRTQLRKIETIGSEEYAHLGI